MATFDRGEPAAGRDKSLDTGPARMARAIQLQCQTSACSSAPRRSDAILDPSRYDTAVPVPLSRAVPSSFAVAVVLLVACGARTELLLPGEAPAEAGPDVTTTDAPLDAEAEADVTDALSECSDETYCDAADPSHIYRCGKVVATCGPLEQCEEREARRAVRQPVPRLARQQHVERLRVLRRRDGHHAGSDRRLLRGLRRQPVEDRRAGASIEVSRGGRGPPRRAVRAHPGRAPARGSRTRPSTPGGPADEPDRHPLSVARPERTG